MRMKRQCSAVYVSTYDGNVFNIHERNEINVFLWCSYLTQFSYYFFRPICIYHFALHILQFQPPAYRISMSMCQNLILHHYYNLCKYSVQIKISSRTVCTGSKSEMRTVGGEVAFVAAIIADSIILRHRSKNLLFYFFLFFIFLFFIFY